LTGLGPDGVCQHSARLYKRAAEVGPWLDDVRRGPREAMRMYRQGYEAFALMASLLAAMEVRGGVGVGGSLAPGSLI